MREPMRERIRLGLEIPGCSWCGVCRRRRNGLLGNLMCKLLITACRILSMARAVPGGPLTAAGFGLTENLLKPFVRLLLIYAVVSSGCVVSLPFILVQRR